MVAFRMKLAPTMVASMWMTAWKDAGSPNLDKLLKRSFSKDDKDRLDNELSAWKENVLVDQKNLLAQEPMKAEARPDLINAAREMPTFSADMEAQKAAPAAVAAPKPAVAAPAAAATKVKTKDKPTNGPATKEKAKPAKAKKKADDGWGSPADSGW